MESTYLPQIALSQRRQSLDPKLLSSHGYQITQLKIIKESVSEDKQDDDQKISFAVSTSNENADAENIRIDQKNCFSSSNNYLANYNYLDISKAEKNSNTDIYENSGTITNSKFAELEATHPNQINSKSSHNFPSNNKTYQIRKMNSCDNVTYDAERSSVWRIRSLQFKIKNRLNRLNLMTVVNNVQRNSLETQQHSGNNNSRRPSVNLLSVPNKHKNSLPEIKFQSQCSYCSTNIQNQDLQACRQMSLQLSTTTGLRTSDANIIQLSIASSNDDKDANFDRRSTQFFTAPSSPRDITQSRTSSINSDTLGYSELNPLYNLDIPEDSFQRQGSLAHFVRRVSNVHLSIEKETREAMSQLFPSIENSEIYCKNCLTSGSICIGSAWPYDQHVEKFINSNVTRQKNPLTTTFFSLIGKHYNELELYIPNDETAEKLCIFMHKIEKSYQDVPYHSKIHAVDVLAASEVLMNQLEVAGIVHFTPLERLSLLLAAACHDVGHPSVNNHYVFSKVSDSHTRGITEVKDFGMDGLLEKIHSQIALKYLKETGLELSENQEFTSLLEYIILGTDMSRHNAKVLKLDEILSVVRPDKKLSSVARPDQKRKRRDEDKEDNLEKESRRPQRQNQRQYQKYFMNPQNRKEILSIVLHIADLSNPAKNFEQAEQWAHKVCDEFFQQGDVECFESGTISQKIFDRKQTSLEESQVGFITWVVEPLVKKWCDLFEGYEESQKIFDLLEENRVIYEERWQQNK